MHTSPHAEDRSCSVLFFERGREACMIFQRGICLFKIGLFAWLNSWDGHWKFAHTAHGLYAIVFEGLRFASIQTLDDIFQFEQATWNRFRNANPIGAGITRNHSCLPDVAETTCRSAHDYEHEAIERGHTPIMSCNATEVRTVAVE